MPCLNCAQHLQEVLLLVAGRLLVLELSSACPAVRSSSMTSEPRSTKPAGGAAGALRRRRRGAGGRRRRGGGRRPRPAPAARPRVRLRVRRRDGGHGSARARVLGIVLENAPVDGDRLVGRARTRPACRQGRGMRRAGGPGRRSGRRARRASAGSAPHRARAAGSHRLRRAPAPMRRPPRSRWPRGQYSSIARVESPAPVSATASVRCRVRVVGALQDPVLERGDVRRRRSGGDVVSRRSGRGMERRLLRGVQAARPRRWR